MPPIKGQMFQYSEAAMEAAIRECNRGVPTSTAAKKFGVPRTTLLNKVKGKTPIKRKMGRKCYVTEEIERMLVTWTKGMVKRGFPIGKENLQDSVKKIVDDLNIETPFKNGRPGKRWYSSFLKRHPDLITRQPQNLTTSRASVTTSQLKNWFGEVMSYLNENNLTEILKVPKRIFNMDETAFFLNPKGNKVLAAKGEKSVYQQINADEKECYTVLLGGNAAGDSLPPMVIFKYERIPRELSMSVPVSWGVGRSDNGWMTMETFYEYICNIFNKWLDDNEVQRPVLLFIDGHTSHLSYHVSKFCSDNGIILIALFPNATHLLQPMDVAVFRSLKGAWKTAVHSWRLENIDSPILRKVHFCPLLKKVLQDTLVPEIFINGFRKCGLSPWNPDAVSCDSEPPITDLTELQRMTKVKELEIGTKFLEKYIDVQKIAQYKKCETWIGAKEDIELFKFYKKVKEMLQQLNLPPPAHLNSQHSNDDNVCSTLDFISEDSDFLDSNTSQNLKDNMNETNMPPTLQQYIPIREDPKTPSKVNNFQNLQGSMDTNTNSLIMPSTSIVPKNSSINVDMTIPSPFKRALFWPTPKEKDKKKKKEKIPSVISSIQWQKYHESKEKKKAELEEQKKRRAEERKKKKQKKEEELKLKTYNKLKAKKKRKTVNKKTKKTDYHSSSEEEWVESGDSIDDISEENEDDEDENNEKKKAELEEETERRAEKSKKKKEKVEINDISEENEDDGDENKDTKKAEFEKETERRAEKRKKKKEKVELENAKIFIAKKKRKTVCMKTKKTDYHLKSPGNSPAKSIYAADKALGNLICAADISEAGPSGLQKPKIKKAKKETNTVKEKRTQRHRSTSSTSCSDFEMSLASSTEDHVMSWDNEESGVPFENFISHRNNTTHEQTNEGSNAPVPQDEEILPALRFAKKSSSPVIKSKELPAQVDAEKDPHSPILFEQCLELQNAANSQAAHVIQVEDSGDPENATKKHDSPLTLLEELPKKASNAVDQEVDRQYEIKAEYPTTGDYVLVIWNSQNYPGQITSLVSEEGALVSCMKRGKSFWRWPVIKDEQLYRWKDIVCKIDVPKFEKKGCFSIPELDS